MKGIAKRVRAAAACRGAFTKAQIVNDLGLSSYREVDAVRCVIKDLIKLRDAREKEKGVYVYTPKRSRNFGDVIWHLVRSHRRFTRIQIERLSGASAYTVNRYLAAFQGLGFIRWTGREWVLVQDPGPERPRRRKP